MLISKSNSILKNRLLKGTIKKVTPIKHQKLVKEVLSLKHLIADVEKNAFDAEDEYQLQLAKQKAKKQKDKESTKEKEEDEKEKLEPGHPLFEMTKRQLFALKREQRRTRRRHYDRTSLIMKNEIMSQQKSANRYVSFVKQTYRSPNTRKQLVNETRSSIKEYCSANRIDPSKIIASANKMSQNKYGIINSQQFSKNQPQQIQTHNKTVGVLRTHNNVLVASMYGIFEVVCYKKNILILLKTIKGNILGWASSTSTGFVRKEDRGSKIAAFGVASSIIKLANSTKITDFICIFKGSNFRARRTIARRFRSNKRWLNQRQLHEFLKEQGRIEDQQVIMPTYRPRIGRVVDKTMSSWLSNTGKVNYIYTYKY